MVEQFGESGHPVPARGMLRRKNNRDTIHFNADASSTSKTVLV